MKNSSLALVVLSGSMLFGSLELGKAQAVLLNGGFEGPALQVGTVSALGAGDTWVPSVTAAGISIVANSTTTGNGMGNTPYGTQFLTLTSGTSVSQLITGFTTTDDYVLGLDFANVDSTAGSKIMVTISGDAGSTSSTFTMPTAGSSGTSTIPFDSGVLYFVPTSSGSETVTITDLVGSGEMAIDNIALYSVPAGTFSPTQVPEPSSWALMFGALGGLAFWQLRRRRA